MSKLVEETTAALETKNKETDALKRELSEHRIAQQKISQSKMNCFVKKTFADGVYIGEVNERGQKHGKGSLWKQNNYFYFGEWKADQKCGQGVEYTHNEIYEGQWLSDQRNGRGVAHYVRNLFSWFVSSYISVYDGEWKDSLQEGKGTEICTYGYTFEGQFSKGLRKRGTIQFKNGDS